ncbi:hypothetical protein HYR69_11705 [Candidatus Sumerlaeota bacterium]|nr:hypothetical protein [Candidatus Sumerlaeota bacterium]
MQEDLAATNADKYAFKFSIIAYGLASLYIVLLPFIYPLDRVATVMVPDDGFYYLKIARYLAIEGRMTFDGINWTNGFHPFWGWLLAGWIVPLRGCSTDGLFKLVFGFNAALLSAAGVAFALAIRQITRKLWHLSLPMFAGLFFFSNYYLMETALVLLMSGLCLNMAAADWSTFRPIRWVVLGFLLAGLGLSRLDTVFTGAFVFSLIGRSIWKHQGFKAALRGCGITCGTAMIPLAFWLGWTRWSSGHWGTISGTLKMDLGHPAWHGERLAWLLGHTGIAAVLTTVGVLLASPLISKMLQDSSGRWNRLLLILSLGTIIHLIFQTLFVSWAVFGWAVAPYRLVPIAVYAAIAHVVSLRGWRRAPAIMAVFGLLILIFYNALNIRRMTRPVDQGTGWTGDALIAAKWVSRNLEPDAVLGMTDCGIFGYFSERRVVNLDGIVNSWEYQEAIRNDKVEEFLRKCGVRYLVFHAAPKEQKVLELALPSHFYHVLSSPILLDPKDMIYRLDSTVQSPDGVPRGLAIWKFPSTPESVRPSP